MCHLSLTRTSVPYGAPFDHPLPMFLPLQMIIGGGAMPSAFNPNNAVEVSHFSRDVISWNANLSYNLLCNVNVLAARFIEVPDVIWAVSYSKTVQRGFIP